MTDRAAAAEAEAAALLELANEDPSAALPRALALRETAVDDHDDRLAAIAGRAAGLAEAYVGDLTTSVGYLDDAVAAAKRTGDHELEGETEMTAGAVKCWAGDNATGLRSLDRAIGLLHGSKRARALVQRGSVRYRAAEFEASLEDFDAAEPALRSSGDRMWLAHLLANRGLSKAYRGSLPDAEADLTQALEIYAELGHRFSVVQMIHNLGWVAAQLGDVPRALERFDEAEAEYQKLGSEPAELYRDRSAALLSVHLADEAYRSAMRAARLLERDGHRAAYAEALVQAGEAALLAGRLEAALDCATAAESELTRQQRVGWSRYAEVLTLRVRGRMGEAGPSLWRRAATIADELDGAGLASGALAARILAAELALDAGNHADAQDEITTARRAARGAQIDLRAEAWHVTARLRAARGDARGAARAADAGLRAVEQHQALQGATETRAHAAGHAEQLGRFGVRLAWESQRARRVLHWLERTRAGALRYPPVAVPDDTALAADLAELRRVEHAVRTAVDTPDSGARLDTRRRLLEEQIRRRTRRAAGDAGHSSRLDLAALGEALEDRMLVEYGRVADRLIAVTLADGRARLHHGPTVGEVVDAVDSLRFGLGRLAGGQSSDASREAAQASVSDSAARLSRLLLEPLPIADRDLLVVPPPALHALAWGLLPACRDRAVSISPSAELWLRRRGGGDVAAALLFAGPRLATADAEIAEIAHLYGGATRFDAGTGSVAAMGRALERSDMAHLACHGRFRAENPLFSALELADGWMTVYEFERLASVPGLMVLSACDAGLSAERPGDEVMGIVAGLLGAGVRSVVASVGLVPDTPGTAEVMAAFHHNLVGGERADAALAAAQSRAIAAGDLAAASFVCFGHA